MITINTKKIKEMMTERRMYCGDLAKHVGVSVYTIYKIIDNGYPPTWEDLCRIASVFGCTPNDLIKKE